MKLYFIAGEASGDFIGSRIIKSLLHQIQLKNNSPDSQKLLKIYGIGGDQMIKAGLSHSLFPMSKISLMGIFEVLFNILEIHFLIQKTVSQILEIDPCILITIDSPGFNFRIAEKIAKLAPHIIRMHIVAPSVWAYKPERAIKTAWIYNHLLTLLAFEPPLFEKYGLKTDFIGHPIFEQDFSISENQEIDNLKYISNGNIISIAPGSRALEIKKHLKIFAASIILSDFSSYHCIIVCSWVGHKNLIEQILHGSKLNYTITTDRISAFKNSKIVIAKSGTNNLEIAACKTAMIVSYRLNIFTWKYIKRFIKVEYASLINIMAKKEIVPELIQDNCTPEKIAKKLNMLLKNNDLRTYQVKEANKILGQMGFGQKVLPSMKAAKIILKYFDRCVK